MAAAAYYARTIGDDGQLWLLAREAPREITDNYRDRELMGRVFQAAADTGRLWEIGAAASLLASILTAAATRGIWIKLAPNYASWWPAPAMLAVAPVLMEMQCTLTPIYALQTACTYLAAIQVWPGEARPSSNGKLAAAALAIAVVGCVTEYVVSAGAALTFLVLMHSRRQTSATRSAVFGTVSSILIGVAAGYAVYRIFADVEVRPATQLSENVGHFFRRLWTVPFKLAASLLQCFGGAAAREISRIDPVSKVGAVAIVGGAIVAWLVGRDFGTKQNTSPTDDQAYEGSLRSTLLPLAVSIVAGLLPLLVMDRRPDDEGPFSRYYVGVVPLAACATTASIGVLAAPRRRRAAMLAVVWLAAFAAFNHSGRWCRESDLLRSFGTALRPALSGDLTLVFVDLSRTPYKGFGGYYDMELVARITRDWTDDERRRIWIMPAAYSESPAGPDPLSHREIRRPRRPGDDWRISVYCRGVRRVGRASRVLSAVAFEDGSVRMEELVDVRPQVDE
jgi:hypothetical protein